MKNNNRIVCFAKYLLPVLISIFINSQTFAESYTGNPRTVAHDFLDMEKQFGTENRHYEFINSLINKAAAEIKVKKDYSTEEAVVVLSRIHDLLKKEGFFYKPDLLLYSSLERKEADCLNLSAIYTAISEVLMLPIIPACAPNHVFLRFNFNDGSFVNWDPVDGKPYSNDFYIEKKNISGKSIQKGVYLQNLTRKEFLGMEYQRIGIYLFVKKKFNEAIPFFDLSIEYYPKYSSAYHNRGNAYYAINNLDKALADLTVANSLDPSQATTYNTLGQIYSERKEYMKAFDAYAESVKLDPYNYVPYEGLGQIMKNTGKNKEAEEWFRTSKEIKEKLKNSRKDS